MATRKRKQVTSTALTASKKPPMKTKNGYILENSNIDIHSVEYENIDLGEELDRSMGIYGFNVNLERAIPNVRDGLKPVQRKVLYTGYESNYRSNSPTKKAARFVGDGTKYYVHGDASFFDAMVKMGQDFYVNNELINIKGNQGSITGEDHSQMRYLEARLTKFAEEHFKDLDKDSVDWKNNYDNTEVEPTVLPVRYPLLLLNGVYGIGQGWIGSIPPHNFEDVVERTIAYIKNKDITCEELAKDLVPDFPTGGVIINKNDLMTIYTTGNDPERLGNIKSVPIRIRSNVSITKDNNLLITSVPYQITTGNILDSIQKAVKTGKIDDIVDIEDSTNANNGISIKVILKRGADPELVEQLLYKYTTVQVSIAVQFLCTSPDMLQFNYYNLKEMIEEWYIFYKTTFVRKVKAKMSKVKRQIHIDEGLLIALDPKNINNIIDMIRKSKSIPDIKENLKKKWKMTQIQADYISDLKLTALCNMEINKIKEDLKKNEDEFDSLESYFNDYDLIDKEIINILLDGKKKYGKPRKTTAINVDPNAKILVKNTAHTIIITSLGLVKKIDADKFKVQNPNGIGINVGKMKERDFVVNIFNCNNVDQLFLFTNLGRLYSINVYDIKETNLLSYGYLIENLIKLKEGEYVVTSMIMNESILNSNKDAFLLFTTKQGLIKKSMLSLYSSVPKTGFYAIDLNKDDELAKVISCNEDVHVIVTSKLGYIIRYSSSDIAPSNRLTKGVKAMVLEDDDLIASIDIFINDKDLLFIISNKGNGKRIRTAKLIPTNRLKKPKIAMKMEGKDEFIKDAFFVGDNDEITIVSTKKVIKVPADKVPILIKSAVGKSIIKMNKDEYVVAATK